MEVRRVGAQWEKQESRRRIMLVNLSKKKDSEEAQGEIRLSQ